MFCGTYSDILKTEYSKDIPKEILFYEDMQKLIFQGNA